MLLWCQRQQGQVVELEKDLACSVGLASKVNCRIWDHGEISYPLPFPARTFYCPFKLNLIADCYSGLIPLQYPMPNPEISSPFSVSKRSLFSEAAAAGDSVINYIVCWWPDEKHLVDVSPQQQMVVASQSRVRTRPQQGKLANNL